MNVDEPRRFRIPHPGWLLLAGFVLVVLAAGLIVWNRPTLRAIRKVEQLGGEVQTAFVGPHWLRNLPAGNTLHTFQRLVAVDLGGTTIDDAGLRDFGGLNDIEYLDLSGSQVTDAGLKHLGGLASVKYLHLSHTQVSDAGLKHLGGLTKLVHLYLNDTKVSDAGLKCLGGLTNLMYLGLNGTQVSDAGLKHLSGLTKLVHLYLDDTRVSDVGLKALMQAHPQLQLRTSQTAVKQQKDDPTQ